jgi:hypothetical protein
MRKGANSGGTFEARKMSKNVTPPDTKSLVVFYYL